MYTKNYEKCGDTRISLSNTERVVMELFCKECTSAETFFDIYPNYADSRLFFLMKGLHFIL
jgi:hypothetical protein